MTRDRFVLDNSTVCRYRFREANWRLIQPLIRAVQAREIVAYAPPHLLVEFFQVAHRKSARLANARRAVKAHYDWLTDLRIQYVEVDYIGNARDLRLLVNAGAGSYDAIYVHLARRQGIPLCTCDQGIVALQGHIPYLKVLDLDRTAFSV